MKDSPPNWISIGIDPGLYGCVTALDQDYQVLGYWDTPLIEAKKKLYATAEMGLILSDIIKLKFPEANLVRAWLEKAAPRQLEGVSSAFKNGQGFGLWEGILIGLRVSYDVVAPNTWTKVILKDVPAGEPKARSMAKCQRLYPGIPLMKPRGRKLTLDGRSDSALIATYGMMQMQGRQKVKETHAKRPPPRRKKR